MSNGIRTEANVTSTFSYAMQQNCIPLIREIRIVNESGEDAENITVKAEFDPPFAKPFEQTVPTVAAGALVVEGPKAAENLGIFPDFIKGRFPHVARLDVEIGAGLYLAPGADDAVGRSREAAAPKPRFYSHFSRDSHKLGRAGGLQFDIHMALFFHDPRQHRLVRFGVEGFFLDVHPAPRRHEEKEMMGDSALFHRKIGDRL